MPRKTEKQHKKRANGSGSVSTLADGRFRWRVTVGYREGKQVQASGITDTRTKAEQAAAKAVADFARGLLGLPNNITLTQYSERWLQIRKNLAPKTLLSYKVQLSYATKLIGRMEVKNIRGSHIKTALLQLSDRTMQAGLGKGRVMASSTLAGVRTRLKAVFAEALSDGIIHVNPCDGVKRIKPKKTEHAGQVLDFAQVNRFNEIGTLLYEAGIARLWPALFTLAAIGLRRGECMGLRWQDIDLQTGKLWVRQNATTADKGKVDIRQPKTESGVRKIDIPKSLIAVLEKQKSDMMNEANIRGTTISPDSPVFATIYGTYTSPDNLSRALHNLIVWSHPEPVPCAAKGKRSKRKDGQEKRVSLEERLNGVPITHRTKIKAAIQAGEPLPSISPHDLRHTAATLMIRKGTPIEVVAKILGHTKASFTLDVYRHVLDSERRAHVVDLFSEPLPVRDVAPIAVS